MIVPMYILYCGFICIIYDFFSEYEGVIDRVRPTVRAKTSDFTLKLEGENTRNRILKTIQPLMGRCYTLA